MEKVINTLSVANYICKLENASRENILKRQDGKGLVVLEGLYFLKVQPESWMTFDQIYRLLRDNFGCSRRLVYEGLQTKLIFLRKKSQPRARQRGAVPYVYRVPSPLELKAEYAPDAGITPHDELKREDLRSLASYRRALHRELYVRKFIKSEGKGFKMYRGLQAERLGVSTRTVRTYDQILGFSHDANYIEKRIRWEDWEHLPRYKQRFTAQGKPLPSRKWLRIHNWEQRREQSVPYVAYLAYDALRKGYDVYEVSRGANTYYPYQRPKPDHFTGDDSVVDFYFANKTALEKAGFYREDNQWLYRRI